MVVEYLLECLVVLPSGGMEAVHVGVIDDSWMELEGVQQVVGELNDGAEKGCTVEVMLSLKWAADVSNVHVYGGRVWLMGEVGWFWVVLWVPYACLSDYRGYCGLDVPYYAPFDDDHVAFDGAL